MTKSVPSPIQILQPSKLSPELTVDVVMSGPLIHPEDRIKLFSADEWEKFIQEWVDSLRNEYELVERCGGAGDMGRDIIAIVKDGNGMWDNYQCKHYGNSLTPSDIWVELGKLAYYTKRGEYECPRHYYFIAPKGAGIKLANLLRKPEDLKRQLLKNWDTYCRDGITITEKVECCPAMQAHINTLDFSIFKAMPVLRIIEGHAKTCWHVQRFGGGLAQRPNPVAPPNSPTENEAVFVGELRRAYAEYLKQDLKDIDVGLANHEQLREHFHDARVEFYSAEGLRAFSRDTLPPGEFDKLQDEVYSGIKDDVRGEYSDGYRRVLAVVKTARTLQLTSNSLITRMHTRDRGGICHQLVNDGKFQWTK